MKLNLGCGTIFEEGYINCDVSPDVNPDRIVDLEKKLPFADNSVEEIVLNHVLEHITNFIPLMHEIHRICEPDAIINIKVPFFSAWGHFNDPTHVRFFTPFTFGYFEKVGCYSHEVNMKKQMFEVLYKYINFGMGRAKKLNFVLNPLINLNQQFYCRFLAWIIPSTELVFKLRVMK